MLEQQLTKSPEKSSDTQGRMVRGDWAAPEVSGADGGDRLESLKNPPKAMVKATIWEYPRRQAIFPLTSAPIFKTYLGRAGITQR